MRAQFTELQVQLQEASVAAATGGTSSADSASAPSGITAPGAVAYPASAPAPGLHSTHGRGQKRGAAALALPVGVPATQAVAVSTTLPVAPTHRHTDARTSEASAFEPVRVVLHRPGKRNGTKYAYTM